MEIQRVVSITAPGTFYVLGGQNFKVVANPDCPPPCIDCLPFLPASDFFNDVWCSRDGVSWTAKTNDAGWARALGRSRCKQSAPRA